MSITSSSRQLSNNNLGEGTSRNPNLGVKKPVFKQDFPDIKKRSERKKLGSPTKTHADRLRTKIIPQNSPLVQQPVIQPQLGEFARDILKLQNDFNRAIAARNQKFVSKQLLEQPQPSDAYPQFTPIELSLYRALGQPQPSNQAYTPRRVLLGKEVVDTQPSVHPINNVAQEINAAGPSNPAAAAEQQPPSIFDTQINALIREIPKLRNPETKRKAQFNINGNIIPSIAKKALNIHSKTQIPNMSPQEQTAFRTLKGEIAKVVNTFRSDKTENPKNLELLENEIKTAISNALETTIKDILLQPSTTVAEQPQPSILDTQINALIREIPKLRNPETKYTAQIRIRTNIIPRITKKALNISVSTTIASMSPQEQAAFYTLKGKITEVVDTFSPDKTENPKNLELLENEIKTAISNALETTIKDILHNPAIEQPSIFDVHINALIREIPNLRNLEINRKAQISIYSNIIPSITKKALNLGTHKRVVDMSPQEKEAFYTLKDKIIKVVDTFSPDKTENPKNLELLENEIKTVISNALGTTIAAEQPQTSDPTIAAEQPQTSVYSELTPTELSILRVLEQPQTSGYSELTPTELSILRVLEQPQTSNSATAAEQPQTSNGEQEALWEETSRLLNIGSSFRDGTQQSLEQPQPNNLAATGTIHPHSPPSINMKHQNIQGNVGDNPQTSVDQINNAEVTSNLYPAVQLQAGAYQTNNVAQEINAAGPSNQATAAEQPQLSNRELEALLEETSRLLNIDSSFI